MSTPPIETEASAVRRPAIKSDKGAMAKKTGPNPDHRPQNPESKTGDAPVALHGASSKHNVEHKLSGVEDFMSRWSMLMDIRKQISFVDDHNIEYPKETIVRDMGVVKSLAEYLGSLEQRIQKSPAPFQPYSFFHAYHEFDANGQFTAHNNDRFLAQSNSKRPNSLIQAVYWWADERTCTGNPSGYKYSIKEPPKPDQIDLVALTIYSTPIARFFEKELGLDVINHDIVRIGTPFRPLLRNLQAIRHHTEVLQKSFTHGKFPSDDARTNTKSSKSPSDISGSLQESEEIREERYNRHEAIGHFQLLLEFVDQYLSKQVSFYRRLNSGHGEKIAFQNLWMLFDTDSTIYCPIQKRGTEIRNFTPGKPSHFTQPRYLPQAYRVVATAGGIPLTKSLVPRYRDESQLGLDYTSANFLEFVRSKDGSKLLAKENSSQLAAEAEKNKTEYSPLRVMCFYVDFDGIKYDTVTEIFVFKPYDGDIHISSLEAYPLQYHRARTSNLFPDGSLSESNFKSCPPVDALVERGQRFIDATAVTHMSYNGLSVGTVREEINSEIMIDFRTAFGEYPDSFQTSGPVIPQYSTLDGFWPEAYVGEFFEYDGSFTENVWRALSCTTELYRGSQIKKQQQMETKIKALLEDSGYEKVRTGDDYQRLKEYMEKYGLIQLLPGVVPGYALQNQRWVMVDLTQLRPIRVVDGWDQLVLPEGHSEMIQAMVETHAGVSRSSMKNKGDKLEMDLVRGKGKGCTILLHGAPGVGKTSTAECVASYTGRPIYPITCGEIGFIPDLAEKKMEEHFKLARRWGCVVLLDEAEVFLAKRTKDNIEHNGLVSVFMRILEYHTGIVFLTTNRVGAIDDAFRSRLHLTLYYPKLNGQQTREIWKTNLKSIDANNDQRQKNNQLPIHYDGKKLLKWLDQNWEAMQWNGRQIHNAFQTAIALAEFKAVKSGPAPKKATLSTELFERIALGSMEFSDYLSETHGGDEDHLASRDQVRPKNFEPKAKIKLLEDSDSSSESSSD